MVKNLHVFDFDNTLFRSPLPPDWWPSGKGWWGSIESLSPPLVPKDPGHEWWIDRTVSAMRRSISNQETYTVVLTGRIAARFTMRVNELLRNNGITPHEVILLTRGPTDSYKIVEMRRLVSGLDGLETVEIWEDRLNHLARFTHEIGKLGVTVVPHAVVEDSMDIDESDPAVQHARQQYLSQRR